MAAKTKEEIAQSIIDLIQSYRPDADIATGTVLKDIVIDQVAEILEVNYDDLESIRKSHSINYASELSDSQVDDLAANWNLTRLVATAASGQVTFTKYSQPSTTIRIGNADGSGGVVVSTQRNTDGSYYSFITTETVYLTPTTIPNSTTGYYEVTAAVSASVTGTASNVAAGTISVFSGVSNVDAVNNQYALSGGTDIETSTALILRIQTASQSRLLGTRPGYISLISEISGVEDVEVVTPNSSERIRSAYGNEVDIIILGDDIANTSETLTYSGASNIYIANTPVSSITQVAGTTIIYTEGIDYEVVLDSTSETRNSNEALDKIVWLTGGSAPSLSSSYTVTYSYNRLVTTVQDELDSDENNLVTSDVLIRQGVEVLVDVELTAGIYSGTNSSYAETQIVDALTDYINSLELGDPLQQSDIVFYLRDNLSFIDNITVPFTKLARSGGSGAADLTATKLEYFRPGALTVHIS